MREHQKRKNITPTVHAAHQVEVDRPGRVSPLCASGVACSANSLIKNPLSQNKNANNERFFVSNQKNTLYTVNKYFMLIARISVPGVTKAY